MYNQQQQKQSEDADGNCQPKKDICNINLVSVYDCSRRICDEREIKRLLKEFMSCLSEIYNRFPITNDCLNFDCVAQTPYFQRFLKSVENLAYIDLCKLNECSRKALFINVYNAWVYHTFFHHKLGLLDDKDQRYNVGGLSFDASALFHGILRSNRPMDRCSNRVRFNDKDPRLNFTLCSFDERIHFALMTPFDNSPKFVAYNIFEPVELGKQLDLQTFETIADKFQYCKYQFRLPNLFNEFAEDFGVEVADCVRYAIAHLTDENCASGKISVNFDID